MILLTVLYDILSYHIEPVDDHLPEGHLLNIFLGDAECMDLDLEIDCSLVLILLLLVLEEGRFRGQIPEKRPPLPRLCCECGTTKLLETSFVPDRLREVESKEEEAAAAAALCCTIQFSIVGRRTNPWSGVNVLGIDDCSCCELGRRTNPWSGVNVLGDDDDDDKCSCCELPGTGVAILL